MKKNRIFISGKITGERIYECIAKFDAAENKLKEFYPDADIINPLKLEGITFGVEHEYAMILCKDEIPHCDIVYFLSDWKDSSGARDEYDLAVEESVPMLFEDIVKMGEWIPKPLLPPSEIMRKDWHDRWDLKYVVTDKFAKISLLLFLSINDKSITYKMEGDQLPTTESIKEFDDRFVRADLVFSKLRNA